MYIFINKLNVFWNYEGKREFFKIKKKKSWINLILCNDVVRKDFCDFIYLLYVFVGCKIGFVSNFFELDFFDSKVLF